MSILRSALRTFPGLSGLLAMALLSGCASSHVTYLSDASAAHQVECPGVFGSWDACRSQALDLCAGHYEVLGRNHQDGASEEQVEAAARAQGYHDRSMLVQCATAAAESSPIGA
ncbi:hypothetical protein [Pseudomonas sp. nanlin1]|uniref:hypothetical protein n=1 Tax=Pseudomonas sp. nanlin1 TaxID=3040605 RepID=UPI00388F62E1